MLKLDSNHNNENNNSKEDFFESEEYLRLKKSFDEHEKRNVNIL